MASLPVPVNPRLSAQDYANRVLGVSGTTPQPNLMDRGAVKVMGGGGQSASTLSAAQRPAQQAYTPDSVTKTTSQMHDDRMRAIRQARQRSRAAINGSLGVPGYQAPAAPARGGSGQGYGGAYGLTPKAGQALQQLRAAYRQQFGQDLPINSGGRTRQEQAELYAAYKAGRGNLAAPPGHSVHESGRAVDFGGAAHYGNTPQHAWLVANAPKFGWLWTGKNFSQREDWHFEYQG